LALVGPETFTLRALLERLLAVLGRRRLILPLSFPAAEALAAGVERLPDPPLTREEVRLLRTDKVANGLPTPAALGLAARRLDQGLPASLHAELGQEGYSHGAITASRTASSYRALD
jgi:NADH dehydrogenase